VLALLTTTGARTDGRRTTPVGFVADGDRYLVVASAGGGTAPPRPIPQPDRPSPGHDGDRGRASGSARSPRSPPPPRGRSATGCSPVSWRRRPGSPSTRSAPRACRPWWSWSRRTPRPPGM